MNRTQWHPVESTSIVIAAVDVVVINTITLGFVQSAVFLFAFFFPQPKMWMFFQPRHLGAHNAFAVIVIVVGTFQKSQMNVHEILVMEREKVTLFSLWHYWLSDKWINATKNNSRKKKNENFVCAFAIAASVCARDNWWTGDGLKWNGMGWVRRSIHSILCLIEEQTTFNLCIDLFVRISGKSLTRLFTSSFIMLIQFWTNFIHISKPYLDEKLSQTISLLLVWHSIPLQTANNEKKNTNLPLWRTLSFKISLWIQKFFLSISVIMIKSSLLRNINPRKIVVQQV